MIQAESACARLAAEVFPKMTDVDSEKLASFYSEMRAEAFRTGGAPMTARRAGGWVQTCLLEPPID